MLTKKQSPYLPELATIVRVEELTETEKLFEIKFKSGKELGHKPGQFVEVSVFGVGEAPISVSSSPTKKESFELVVRKVGSVTSVLHFLKKGATVGIRGPFGTYFPYQQTMGKDVLFVGGGLGLIPLRSFINFIIDNRDDYGRLMILFGSRSPKERLFIEELVDWDKRTDVEFFESVDKGDEEWEGHVGVITTLFPQIKFDPLNTACMVVGPPIMYRFVIKELLDRYVQQDDIYVSLERRMRCGIGKCGHCQINDIYCCQDGPVFSYTDIAHLEEAL